MSRTRAGKQKIVIWIFPCRNMGALIHAPRVAKFYANHSRKFRLDTQIHSITETAAKFSPPLSSVEWKENVLSVIDRILSCRTREINHQRLKMIKFIWWILIERRRWKTYFCPDSIKVLSVLINALIFPSNEKLFGHVEVVNININFCSPWPV